MHPRFRPLLAGAALLAAAAGPLAAQQPQGVGLVTGRVVDRATQQPVPDAQVLVVGTTRGARTGADGQYRLTGVAPGEVRLRALRLGYEAAVQTVTVSAGGTATADFALVPTATRLDQVVVTATGEEQRARERGNAIASIAVDSVPRAVITDLTDLLAARASGVIVTQASGTTGAGSRVRIRGSNSVSLTNEPLVIIDGIRAQTSDAAQATTIDIGGQNPSRLDELNPEDIESVEIIKGPAGVALYGTAAANGVIQITTKKGRAGDTRWTVHLEGGSVTDETDWPANFARVGTTASGNRTTACTLNAVAAGSCTPKPDSLVSFNPFVQSPVLRDGSRTGFGASVGGGSGALTYYLSADHDREIGVYPNNEVRRTSLRVNLAGQITPELNVTVNSGYIQSRLDLPQNDNNDLGLLGNGLFGSAFGAPNEGYLFYPPNVFRDVITTQDMDRFVSSVNGDWRPLSWLRVVGIAGLDYGSRTDGQILPPGLIPPPDNRTTGSRTSNPYSLWTYTANLGATGTWNATEELVSTTSVGTQYANEQVHGTQAFGRGLAAGTQSLAGTTSEFAVLEQNSEIVTVGGYLQQQLAWRDRLFVTAAVRGDDNSNFGEDFSLVWYPTASVSWVMNEEPWFPRSRWLSSFRLRGAFGQSGQRPGFRNAVTFYNVIGVRDQTSEVGGAALGDTVGNPALKPERSTEFEAGFDLGLFDRRVSLEVTAYDKTTKDALILRQLAPSVGALSRFENLGEVNNRGFEALLNATLVDRPEARWDVTLTGSTNRNKLVEIGQDVDTIFFGLGANDGNPSQRFVEGHPLGSYWQRPIVGWADANSDGILSTDEVQLADEVADLGNPLPKHEVALNTAVTLFGFARLSALVDYRGGYTLYNSTEQFRCVVIVRCRAAYDPTAPLDEQARRIASLNGSDAGYMEDASFWKLREVALTLTVPERWAQRVRASGLTLTLAGRNLATWTDYTGFDPELNFNGTSNFSTADFLTQPPTRQFTARLSASW